MTFISNAVGGLKLASRELRHQREHYQALKGWFRRRLPGVPQEEAVSDALAELFRAEKSSQIITGSGLLPFDLRHISIDREVRRPLDTGIGKNANPTDYMFTIHTDTALDLRIEAKVVLTQGELKKVYMGSEGLLRYENPDNPYTIAPFGGMVAYVVDLDTATWAGRIDAEIDERLGPVRKSMISVTGDSLSVSRHTCVSTSTARRYDVEVFHLVLEIDAEPVRR